MEVKAEGELERSFGGKWGELVYLLAFKSNYTGTTPPYKDISHILYVNLYINFFCKPGLEGF